MTPGSPKPSKTQGGEPESEAIPIRSVLPSDSPRANGEDKAHILRLAESDAVLPPILVHRSSMRVIDGMHRLRAAQLKGLDEITVTYFDGSDEDAFVMAVKLNVTHGLPLSLSDRKTAATRILAAQPQLSDRAIASISGLSNKTVAALRPSASAENAQSHTRLGADGRLRPLDAAEGRHRAAAILSESPEASLRDISASSGISPGTVRDVRRRLQRGEDPVAPRPQVVRRGAANRQTTGGRKAADHDDAILPKLTKDPSLRHTEGGRELLRWLHSHVIRRDDCTHVVDAVPEHCSAAVARLARQSADAWSELAWQMEQRVGS